MGYYGIRISDDAQEEIHQLDEDLHFGHITKHFHKISIADIVCKDIKDSYKTPEIHVIYLGD